MTASIPNFKTPEFFGLEDKWIETDSGELTHYYDIGKGTPVMFLHGSGTGVSASANWWKNLPELGKEVRAIAFDFIGYGETVTPADIKYGIREWVNHTIRLMDALDIEKTWLVGNSLGGWVGFQMAIDHPERLHGIISMGTGGAKLNKALAAHSKPDVSKAGIRRGLEMMVTDKSLVNDTLVDIRYAAALKDEAEERLIPVVTARDRDRDALPLDLEKLSQLTMPILLIHGKDDKVIPLTRTWELLTTIPDSEAHIFSGCGHWSQIERADDFNQLITHYLAGQKA
ncbi:MULTISPECIES: alpha/beta fold hydrolase [Psychrobacter]|uniref:alpha/beta fold hydrolase n=1 Tax=Psychrobacter TaxID=497 RepID=UPI000EEE1BB5|nr:MULTISPECIES: alpha/beta hydrolase [Psychrobacter]HCT72813.1 alpha/beta hydrolase [Psychrobacter sp.]